MRQLTLIKGGVVQADTGQTTVFDVPPFARYASFYLKVKAAAGTTPKTDFVLYTVPPEITAAPAVATSTGGDGTHDEVQTVTLTGGPTYGVWSLTWPGVSADTSAVLSNIPFNASAAQLQQKFVDALATNATYRGEHIVVTRSGSGTSGAPYVYTLTHSGATVDKTNIDAVTVDGSALATYTTDTEFGAGNIWDGVTQIAGTTASGVAVHMGPGVTGIADDDTGAAYFINAPLPSRMAAKVTLDRADADEIYTYALYADYSN